MVLTIPVVGVALYFTGGTLSYVEQMLKRKRPGTPAVSAVSG